MAAILGIVASFLGPAIELGKCIAEPIKRQFNYLCCLDSNIQNLRDEEKKLEDARDGLQMRVTIAKNNAEEIVPEVKTWLEKANEVQVNMIGIDSEITNIQSGCLTIKSRFSLSKKVKKTTEAMKQLRECCNFNLVSLPAPPASMVSMPLGSAYEFESRKHIEEEIMITLRGNKVNMIGICGMGGVGKTTMAKRIMNRVREEHLFDEMVMVVVSQQADKLRIQDDIAKSLGLKLEEGSLSSKAHKLRTRLLGGKRILIVLDDVWKNLKLEDLGIPCESGLKGCTILLTSRDRGVLHEMDAQKVCEIPTLSEIEAWSLFKEKVGICIDDQNLLSIAQEIAKECKGLPIALVNVAVALKYKKQKFIWEDALQQLKSSNPIDMPHILAQVYNPLKLSYDFLDSQHAKSIFLLCCLFPEDRNIPLEYLTVYTMGLRIFEEIRNLRQTRNRTCSLVEMLKSRFLLLEGSHEYHVRMHDVVRDVSIFIASKERRINCNDCTWISPFLGERIELHKGSNFPNLRLLLIDNSADEELQINDNFFEGMQELNVLSMKYDSLRSLPHTIQLLKNLRTLLLCSCKSLKTMSVVGELVNLEILICHSCDSIKELPVEIGRLNRLKLLEFSYSEKLKTIAPGVISSLIGLEELKMIESFDKWEAEVKGKKRKNAALGELQFLSNLTCLEIEIKDSTLAGEQINLPSMIVKYGITVGYCHAVSFSSDEFEKKLSLHLPREIALGNWIHECVKSTEYMCLEGEGSNNLDLGQAQNMRSMTLGRCSTMKKLVNITTSNYERCGNRTTTVFPLLEFLRLENLDNLEAICGIDGPIPEGSSNSRFKNPKELRLEYQKDIRQKSPRPRITFPKLKSVELRNLPRLIAFCKGIESIEFPLLIEMIIKECPKLKSLVSTTSSTGNNKNNSGNISHDHDHDSLHLFCELEKSAFGSLKELSISSSNTLILWCHQIPFGFFTRLHKLWISYCGNIRSLFSSSIAENLISLKNLGISRCGEMVKVIEDDEEEKDACDGETICLFPNMELLYLDSLPELKSFCQWTCALELPSLKEVEIYYCPQMGRFTLGSLTTPNMKEIRIGNKDIINTKDLNDALQQHFYRVKEEEAEEKEEEADDDDEEEEEEEEEEEKEDEEEEEEKEDEEEEEEEEEEDEREVDQRKKK